MEKGSLGGIILVGILAYWFLGCGEENAPTRGKAAKILPPLGELIIQTKLNWAKTVGLGLKLTGLVLEIEYHLADGEKGRRTHDLSEEISRKLKPGDKIILRDEDGVERECVLMEIKKRDTPVPGKLFFVRFQLDRSESRILNEKACARLVGRLMGMPGIPFGARPVLYNRFEVRYGPLPFPRKQYFRTLQKHRISRMSCEVPVSLS